MNTRDARCPNFYDDGGVLAADLSIYDWNGAFTYGWTLSEASDLIGGVGGNRYGWFVQNEFGALAFDRTSLCTQQTQDVPDGGATMVLLGIAAAALAGLRRRL